MEASSTRCLTWIVLLVCVSHLCCSNRASAGIVEKETVRYFTFEESEYPLDADGRLSDSNAREILLRLRKLYERVPPLTTEDYESLCDIRDNLHRVYAGEVYEEILFTCIKAAANYAVYLQRSPREDEAEDKTIRSEKGYSRGEGTEVRFYGGRMLRVTTRMQNYVARAGNTCYYIEFHCVLAARRIKENANWGDNQAKWFSENESYAENIASSRAKFEREEVAQLLEEAANDVASFIEGFIAALHKNGNHRSVIFEEQWDPILEGIPRAINDSPAENHPSVSKDLASRLTTVSLRYMKSTEARAALEQFATEAGLDFTRPTPVETKPF